MTEAAVQSRSAALGRLRYLARIARVYARPATGPLSFWHERPEINEAAFVDGRRYFMRFQGKAAYAGPFDSAGVPLLDYRGDIGRSAQPDRHRAVRPGPVQSLVQNT